MKAVREEYSHFSGSVPRQNLTVEKENGGIVEDSQPRPLHWRWPSDFEYARELCDAHGTLQNYLQKHLRHQK